jgi:hypothetical protein
MPETPIRGQVMEVRQQDGQTFVQLNVGEKDNVLPDMKFWVHRGEKFLGTVRITAVNAQSSAGKVQLAQGTVKKNDQVLTGGL